ncbi:putative Transcriptional regulator [Desulfosarcina cetonica]|nr:putative Transcriptional regulator [Desulfosarcina cetonica]
MVPYLPYSRLKVFYYVARHGNYSQAADALFITKGAISQQLKDLESRLECILFDKSGGKSVLTPNGENLYNLVAPIVERCESLGLEFKHQSGKLTGKIKIASFTGMLLYVLPDYVKKFKELYPECEIILFNVSGKEIRSMVLSGEADFGIGSLYYLPYEILGKAQWTYDRYLIAPLGHKLSKKKNITFQHMAQYPIIMPDIGGVGGEYLKKSLKEYNPNLNITMEAVSWEVVMKYVELGYGISMVPEIILQPDSRKRLCVKNLSESDPKAMRSKYGIIVKRGKYHTPAARKMIKFLSPEFKEEI